MITAATIAIALVLAAGAGGDLRRLAITGLRHGHLIVLTFAVQGFLRSQWGMSLVGAYVVPLWATCCLLTMWFLWGNRSHPGVILMIGGIAANVLVVLANAGMPVAVHADQTRNAAHFYNAMVGSELLGWMGDVLPAGPWLLSVGDALMLAGVVVFIVALSSARGLKGMDPSRIQ